MSGLATRKTPGDTSWFVHDRFGMFIHWGLYSMPARHEWIKHLECIPEEKYDLYFKHFDPDQYNPREWARMAKEAGMKYAVLTTKHHEGFCLWDSACTDYKSTNTPAGRDLVREYVDAFRAEGIRIGFYYSLIDWHHPDFTVDVLHPRRNDSDSSINEGRDMRRYAKYMRDQVAELLGNYGKIDILWFDFSYSGRRGEGDKSWQGGKGKDDWEAEALIKTARDLQPGIIIDNRTELEQDLWTPEQFQPREWLRHEESGELVVWEACQTFSGSWGYHRDEQTWKSPKMLIDMLVNTVSIGGNLLMNVGPTSRGEFDARAKDALDAYAEWMHGNGRAIYGCTASEFAPPQDARYTQNGDRLYLHLLAYPFRDIELAGLAGKLEYAQFLHDGSEVLFVDRIEHGEQRLQKGSVMLQLPPVKPPVEVPVIELFLK